MWIERMEIAGFGNIAGEKIEFEDGKLNLVVESNEYGKSTMATAVWAGIFDFPPEGSVGAGTEREYWRPRQAEGALFGVTIWISTGERSLKIVRDFNQKSVRVLDRNAADRDVTTEFKGADGSDETGLKITGMTREMFRSTCFVGQRELDENSIDEDVASALRGIADSSTASHTAGSAIFALDHALNQFQNRGSRQKVEQLIRNLELERKELHNKLSALEEDQMTIFASHIRLSEIDELMENANGGLQDESSVDAIRQVEEIDNRLLKLKQTIHRVGELQAEIDKAGLADDRVPEWEIAVRDLWSKREMRKGEYENLRLDSQQESGASESDDLERGFQRKWRGLAEFSPQDSQSLSLLILRLTDLEKELSTLKDRHQSEAAKLQRSSIDMGRHQQAKEKLSSLDQKDTSDALSYSALIETAKQQITESERSVVQYRAQLLSIDSQRKAQKNKDLTIGCIAGGVFLVLLIVAILMRDMLWLAIVCGVLALAAAAGTGFFIMRYLKPGQFKKKEFDKIEVDLDKATTLAQQLVSKIGALEGKLESIARKAGISGGRNELMLLLGERSEVAPRMRDIESLDGEIASKEAQFKRSQEELEMYFHKAGIPSKELTMERARKLSEDVAKCVEEGKSIQTATSQTRLKLQQLGLLHSEIESIEGKLKEIFQSLGISSEESLDSGYRKFNSQLEAYYRVQRFKGEISRIEHDSLGDSSFGDLSDLIVSLESKRSQLREQISGEAGAAQISPQTDRVKLSDERNEVILRLRLAAKNFDDNFLNTLEQLNQLERDLAKARQAKLAIELARDTLRKLSGENYVDWSTKLNLIADEMVKEINLDYESLSFSNNLQLKVRRKGETEAIKSPELDNRLSVGTKEQLNWLARMVVSRYLSKDNPLPIVLDEPFSESDDERFKQIMQFVVEVLSRKHQVIVFSCHRQRHQWFFEQLGEGQRQRISFRKRGAAVPRP